MSPKKRNKRNVISYILITLLLIGSTTSACLIHILRLQQESHFYHQAQPVLYISDTRAAEIWSITSYSTSFSNKLPQLTLLPLPMPRDNKRERETTLMRYVAIYNDSTWAAWCRIHPDRIDDIIEHFGNNISNGFDPIVEKNENGTLFHFTTDNKEFLHLYYHAGVMGYSFEESHLTRHDNDSALLHAIEKANTFPQNQIFYFENKWEYRPVK